MKIYRLNWCAAGEDGQEVSWFTSRRAAEKELARKRRSGELGESFPVEIKKIEIDTARDGLVAWLNENFNTDNG